MLLIMMLPLALGLSGQFLQLSDLVSFEIEVSFSPHLLICSLVQHYDMHYLANSEVSVTRCHAENGTAGALGERAFCDSPELLLNGTLKVVAALANVDFILLTGDLARHDDYKPIPRTFDEVMQENAQVAKWLAQTFPDIPVIPTIGNNDVYPHDTMHAPGPDNKVLPALAKAWAPLLDGAMTESMLHGGYMSKTLANGNTVVSLNTLYFAYGPDCNVSDSPALIQLEWLSALLDNVVQDESNMILMGHIPPSLWLHSCRALYAQMCVKYSDIITGNIFGHLHSDQFHFVNIDGSVDAAELDSTHSIAVTCSPSVVPTFNPSFRIWKYDPNDLVIIDYVQYYADLDKLYQNFEFHVEYSLRDAYGMTSFSGNVSSVDFWIALNKKLANDITLGIKYELFKFVSVIEPPQPDDEMCKTKPYC